MILIGIIGVLSTVALVMVGQQPIVIKDTKLSSDVATLNQLVSAYVMDGGSLTGLTSPQAVLDKMKRARPSNDLKTHVGASSGRMIDTRLRAKVTAAPNANGAQRARWNTQKQRFELTTSTGSAVSEFFIDESLTATDFGTDTTRKKSNVSFNASRGWVWGDTANPSAASYGTPSGSQGDGSSNLFDPDEVETTPPPSGGGGGGGTLQPDQTLGGVSRRVHPVVPRIRGHQGGGLGPCGYFL